MSIEVGLKTIFGPIFDEKSLSFEKFGIISSQKTLIELFSNPHLSSKMKSLTLPLTILICFPKNDENLGENTENVKKNKVILSTIDKTLNLENCL